MHINTAMAKWETKSWKIEETTLHEDGSSTVLNITLEKERKKREKVITTRGNRSWSPIQVLIAANRALLSGWNMLLSLRYHGDSMLECTFLNFYDEKRHQKEKRNLILHGWESSMGQKIRGIWKWELLLALVIGQGALPL